MVLVTVSNEELSRIAVIQDVLTRRLSLTAASYALGLSYRQVLRLRDRFAQTVHPHWHHAAVAASAIVACQISTGAVF
jgi:hypothetical protein